MTVTVRDLMHPEVLSCSPDSLLGQVAQLLAQHHVHSLFIFESDPVPVGVITDYDLMAGEWLSGDDEIIERDTLEEMTGSMKAIELGVRREVNKPRSRFLSKRAKLRGPDPVTLVNPDMCDSLRRRQGHFCKVIVESTYGRPNIESGAY